MTRSAKAENALELTDLSVAYRVAGRNRAVHAGDIGDDEVAGTRAA